MAPPDGRGGAPEGGAGRAARPGPSLLRALRHRNYQLFFAGQLVSLVGTWMQSVAQSWLVYRLTGSSLLLGTVGFATQIPVFLLAPIGGAVADRRQRHRILVATQSSAMVLALGLAALTLSGHVVVWHILAFGVLLGAVNAFDIPARQSFVVEMVGREDLANAIALNSSMFNGARIIGPAVAGILVGAIGEAWCFLANGVSFLAVIASLLAMHVPPRPPPAGERGSALAATAEGFRFVARTGAIRALLVLLGVVSVTAMPYAVLMPIFADRILGGGAQGLGTLMGASGVGALLGALVLASRKRLRGLGAWVAAACAGFGAALILFALSRTFWLSALLLVPVGFSMMVQMAGSNTLVQAMVPDALRGRVMAVYAMMFMGMAPLGALLAGTLADRIGAPATVASGGACCIVAAAVFARRLPSLRQQARELIIAQQMAAGTPAEQLTQAVAVAGEEAAEETGAAAGPEAARPA
ncbi:MFS transporter [Sorangium cellulosum]|uniref:MFS transporter n=1 Tax=Sorangium cellulosum TaxID=56 RepID=A0A2L0EYA8_SORCE|nr:MFS transporter [Sorangium cellulosum]AUX44219.1 MFS transporter [Sorangium cellulosum]